MGMDNVYDVVCLVGVCILSLVFVSGIDLSENVQTLFLVMFAVMVLFPTVHIEA